MQQSTNPLFPYTVEYREADEDIEVQYFECMAEDESHAREQCENAYPTCEILSAYLFGSDEPDDDPDHGE